MYSILFIIPAGVFACYLLLTQARSVHGTTFLAPLLWACTSLLAVVGMECAIAQFPLRVASEQSLRYLAATMLQCPMMAILGAKRPQNVGWQLIVITLWVVLALPVFETMLLWRGGALDVGPARRWFLLVLLSIGLGNYLLTRFWLAILLATAGQICLLQPHLPISLGVDWHRVEVGVGLLCGSAVAAWIRSGGRKGVGWDAVWSDYRDLYGAIWGLRVIERVNTTARVCGWNVELSWFGFCELPTPSDGYAMGAKRDLSRIATTLSPTNINNQQQQQIDRAMTTLLRRFVSSTWISQRQYIND